MSDKILDFGSLTSSFKEAQYAKSCLERDLAEKRQKRQQLEATLEAVTEKHAQAKDIHAKMQEARNVALFKVDQTQALIDSLEESNENKRVTLRKLLEDREKEEAGREQDYSKFETELTAVSKLMRDAKTLYNVDNLAEEYEKSVSTEMELEKLGAEYEKKYIDTGKQLQELQNEINRDESRAYSTVTANQLLAIFEKAEKDADAYLQHIDQILEQKLLSNGSAQENCTANQKTSCV